MQHFFSFFIKNKIPILGGIFWRLTDLISPKKVTTIVLNTGQKMKVYPRTFMGKYLYLFGIWEPEVSQKVLKLSKFNTIIDIGAHIGYYSVLFKNILKKGGKIYAFEPDQYSTELLKANVAYFSNQCIIEPFAISSEIDKEVFVKGDRIISNAETDYDYVISSTTLDSYVESHFIEEIDLIKIDIEGYELFALKGMNKTLKEFKPKLIIEIHPLQLANLGHSFALIKELLLWHNYKIELLSEENKNNFTIYCS